MSTAAILSQTSEMKQTRARLLIRLIYLQAVFLSLAYAAGVFATFYVFGPSIGTRQIIGHGILASSFGVLTAVVAFLAGIQGMRKVSIYNLVLFVVTLIGGAAGFYFLGGTSGFTAFETTNMTMTLVMAVGMPVTGLSLIAVSRAAGLREAVSRRTTILAQAALGSLSLTLLAGTGMTSTTYIDTMRTAHFALAGITLAAVVLLAAATIKGAFGRSSVEGLRKGAPFSVLSLLFLIGSVVFGAMFFSMGGLTYVMGMAELGTLVYGFILLSIQRPPLN